MCDGSLNQAYAFPVTIFVHEHSWKAFSRSSHSVISTKSRASATSAIGERNDAKGKPCHPREC
jgi:hypothetical protein